MDWNNIIDLGNMGKRHLIPRTPVLTGNQVLDRDERATTPLPLLVVQGHVPGELLRRREHVPLTEQGDRPAGGPAANCKHI